MTPQHRPPTWRHELAAWAVVVAVAAGLMLALWALVALAIVVRTGP